MPYKSQAQRRLFHFLAKQGKLAPEMVEEYDRESKGKKMPEYASKKAMGGEIMDETSYRAYGGEMSGYARGGEMSCARCGSVEFVPLKAMGGEVTDVSSLHGNMKELYPSRKSGGAKLDDGKIRPFGQMFAQALKMGGR